MNDYESAIDFLYRLQFHGIKLGLDHTKAFLKQCNVEKPRAKIIHIAGTNGKGSTASFIQSILTAHGFKVGLFTSPHILDFRERIRIDGHFVSEDFIINFVNQYESYIQTNQFTFFEVNTVMAIKYFVEESADFIVLETGMGGRLDATNCFDSACAVITNISLDHSEYLGSSLEKICAEKCGIIKTNSIVFCAEQNKELSKQIHDYTNRKKSKFVHITNNQVSNNMIDFKGNNFKNKLLGQHQNLNLITALTVVDYFCDRLKPNLIQLALDQLNWPGRLEFWKKSPHVILDVSHNLEGVKQTINTILENFKKKQFLILCSFLSDKPIKLIKPELMKISQFIYTYQIEQHRYDHKLMMQHFEQEFDKKKSIERLRIKLKVDYILVIGSHYLLEQFIRENHDL